MPRWSSFIVFLSVLLLSIPALAEGNTLADALELRNASTEDRNAERYADAAEKLKRALKIYDQVDGEKAIDRAITLRALTWNLHKAGEADEALQTFHELLEIEPVDAGIKEQIWTSYSAIYGIASSKQTADEVRAVWDPVRERLLELELPGMAAQVLHDLGAILENKADLEGAVDAFELAIKERASIRDELGKTWSLNNLAHAILTHGKLEDALAPLLDAYRQVHELRIVAPQAAVAVNLRTALGKIDEMEKPEKKHATWLWKLAELGAKSEAPEVVPSDDLLRRAAHLSGRVRGEKGSADAARRLSKIKLVAQPAEVKTNQTLFASMLALQNGKANEAARWLEKLKVGSGVFAPHLAARIQTARALAAAARKKVRSFERLAEGAATAWGSLPDRGGQEAALAALTDAAARIEAPTAQDLQAAYNEVRRQGKPGGLGGTAIGNADVAAFNDLALTEPLFEIRVEDGKIFIDDVVAHRSTNVPVVWQPRAVSLNGLALVLFGGWVRIESLGYGGAAAASGQPGTATVETLGAVLPIPDGQKIIVLKNGAVTYGTLTR